MKVQQSDTSYIHEGL